jgi:mRNA-degrading endonuclease RelE of RelBE toxin-antitoxin system
MYEIVIHESADEELNAAALFYESRETDLGQEFLKELSISFNRIREYPYSYSIVFEEYRRCVMARFPFSVVYRIEEESVLVFAVAHLRRRPGYWRNRA